MLAALAELERLPELDTPRTTLRALAVDDAAALFEIYSDPEAMRYWSSPPHADEGRTREMIGAAQRGFEERTTLQWGIERKGDARLLGTVTLMTEPEQPRAELGFILGRDHWGRGYAGEAQRAVIDFAFEVLGLRRLEAETDPRNEASVRSLERLGFRHEGLLRERWIVDQEVSDSAVLALLAREWTGG
jgi:[ribosomal protein S5]-alanine N-acetyltransferase